MRLRTATTLLTMFFSLITSAAIGQLTVSAPNASVVPDSTGSPVERAASGIATTYRSELRDQIRVKVRYVMVESETRKKIYAGLGPKQLQHISPTLLDALANEKNLGEASNHSSWRAERLSSATTCILNAGQAETILSTIATSPACEVRPAPTIFLLGGKAAEMNDTTQHPFVIDMREDATVREPVIKIFDVGTQLRVQCSLDPSDQSLFNVTAQLTCSRIESIETEMIFGISDAPIEVQRPLHSSNVARVTESISTGDVLMIDPHFRSPKTINRETAMPVVGRLPYVGQSFRNSQAFEVQQYMVLLLELGLVTQ